jgi:hypothetical protein
MKTAWIGASRVADLHEIPAAVIILLAAALFAALPLSTDIYPTAMVDSRLGALGFAACAFAPRGTARPT